jgi:protein SCO1/2
MKIAERSGLRSSERFVVSRRGFVQSLLLAAPVFASPVFSASFFSTPAPADKVIHGHGQIKPPLPVPDVKLVSNDGASTTLPRLVEGHVTAVQIMFTSCTTTCPIQAAIFGRVQAKLPDMGARGLQLLSISIDPNTDTPQALSHWLRRFHAGPAWIAAAPSATDARLLRDFFGKGGDAADHSNQVSILDRQGRLVWRTFELPAAEEIISVLQKI